MREIYHASKKGDEKAKLAIDVLAYSIAKYVGAYTVALGGLDALTFTGGLGEKAHYVRAKVCEYLSFLGLKLNSKKNQADETKIHDGKSKIKVFVIPTQEEQEIAIATAKLS